MSQFCAGCSRWTETPFEGALSVTMRIHWHTGGKVCPNLRMPHVHHQLPLYAFSEITRLQTARNCFVKKCHTIFNAVIYNWRVNERLLNKSTRIFTVGTLRVHRNRRRSHEMFKTHWVVSLLKFWTFYGSICMIYKSANHKKSGRIGCYNNKHEQIISGIGFLFRCAHTLRCKSRHFHGLTDHSPEPKDRVGTENCRLATYRERGVAQKRSKVSLEKPLTSCDIEHPPLVGNCR